MATGRSQYPLSISVSGTLTSDGSTPVVFPDMDFDGVESGRPSFVSGESTSAFGSVWALVQTSPGDAEWQSTADVDSPELVPAGAWHAVNNPHAWKSVSPATGTPIVKANYDYP